MQPATLQSVTGCTKANAERYAAPLTAAMDEFSIWRPVQQAAFLAQLAHESARLSVVTENLNYSWQALRTTWPRRFPTDAIARQYHRQPERIASYVYADRMGNGPPSSGDGWRHRGAAWIQVTGKDNQSACAKHFGIPLAQIGDWLRTPEGAARGSAWFWRCVIDGNKFVADGDIEGLSRAINGGTNGLAERLAMTKHAMTVLA